jgi:hypothetical protein
MITIHMIGNNPNVAPCDADNNVWPRSIPYTIQATPIATPSEINAAHCAFIFNPPSNTNNVTNGSAANTDDKPSESDTGSYTCSYTDSSSGRCLGTYPGHRWATAHRPAPSAPRSGRGEAVFT